MVAIFCFLDPSEWIAVQLTEIFATLSTYSLTNREQAQVQKTAVSMLC